MNKLLSMLERLLSLLVVFLLLSGTVVWSGTLFGRKIGASSEVATPQTVAPQPDEEQLKSLNLAGCTLQAADTAAWYVSTAEGEPVGLVVFTAPYAKDVVGYAGPTPLYIHIDPTRTLTAVVVADNSETPHFLKNAVDGVFPKMIGKSLLELQTASVDAVSGATYTSNALIANVKNALKVRAESLEQTTPEPVIGWGRTFAVMAVLILGMVVAWRWKKVKWLRIILLTLNVVVVGFWCGQFLSLSLFSAWIQNGTEPLLYLPALLMLFVAVLMPFVGSRHHYCMYVCPYGSLQELAGRLPLPKIPISPKVHKVLRSARMMILMALLFSLWMGIGTSLLEYEPFTAFLLGNALPTVLILAAGFVVLSLFVPRVWCRFVCPVGTLLDLAEDGGDRMNKKDSFSK